MQTTLNLAPDGLSIFVKHKQIANNIRNRVGSIEQQNSMAIVVHFLLMTQFAAILFSK